MDATVQLTARLLHVLGLIFWIGGSVTAALVVVLAAGEVQKVAVAARKAVLFIATPGMLLAWVAGLTVLTSGWSAIYAKAGWMHGKVTVALIITGLTGVLTGRLRRAAAGTGEVNTGLLRGLAIAILVLAVIVLFLARFQPGGS